MSACILCVCMYYWNTCMQVHLDVCAVRAWHRCMQHGRTCAVVVLVLVVCRGDLKHEGLLLSWVHALALFGHLDDPARAALQGYLWQWDVANQPRTQRVWCVMLTLIWLARYDNNYYDDHICSFLFANQLYTICSYNDHENVSISHSIVWSYCSGILHNH